MTSYCVYAPGKIIGGRELADTMVLERDGFSFPALAFGPLWAVWRRSWFALAIWVAGACLLAAAAVFSGVSLIGIVAIAEILQFAFALEAGSMARRSLVHRGLRLVDVVSAPNRAAAERAFFESWTQGAADAFPGPVAAPSGQYQTQGIGMFPEAGRR